MASENYKIIENFLSLCAIPHKSHHEEKISRFLYDWAVSRGFQAVRDEAGNVVIDKPGTPGCENAPVTILQAHMDMVVVWEEGKSFDPLNDPITVIDDGQTLRGLGTSLGGDDCAGVAMAMTLLEDPDAVHGPIRAIFTVDEEDGMSGAEALAPRHLEGQYMLNLDWEEFGSLCNSSAGSDMYRFRRAPEWEASEGVAYTVSVSGMTGGHSGAEIHWNRANAIRTLAGILDTCIRSGLQLRLCSFKGGSAHNAIPASASATVVLPAADAPWFSALAGTEGMVRRKACYETDPNAAVTVAQEEELPEMCVCVEDTAAYMAILSAVHNGVHTMCASIPGLVESSANIGLAELTEEYMEFAVHQRSSEPAVTDEMKVQYEKDAAEHGFSMEVLSSGPAWPLRPGSELVEICKRHFAELTGKELTVSPVHAGLECGCFSRKNPALDIVSIGPDILDIHSPRETLVLQTVYDCDALVRSVLREIAGK